MACSLYAAIRATQKLRLDSIEPMNPAQPDLGYGLGIIQFAPGVVGHDGQIPGYSSLFIHDVANDTTVITATNLSASPVNGANAGVLLGKLIRESVLGGSSSGADPAAPSGTTATTTGATYGSIRPK